MSLVTACKCGQEFEFPDEAEGSVVTCSRCKQLFVIGGDAQDSEHSDRAEQQILKGVKESQRLTQTKASRPAILKLSRWRMLLLHPWKIGVYQACLVSAVLAFGIVLFGSGIAETRIMLGIFAVFAAVMWLFSEIPWAMVSRTYQGGDTNPTLIVDVERQLVAVHTDLLMHPQTRCPVIKIMKQPVHQIVDGPPQLNHRVVSISGYRPAQQSLIIGLIFVLDWRMRSLENRNRSNE